MISSSHFQKLLRYILLMEFETLLKKRLRNCFLPVDFFEIFKGTFFTEHLLATAFENSHFFKTSELIFSHSAKLRDKQGSTYTTGVWFPLLFLLSQLVLAYWPKKLIVKHSVSSLG